ncbi:hypothetical protein IWW38_006023, partial [Coemansia aciculifera]
MNWLRRVAHIGSNGSSSSRSPCCLRGMQTGGGGSASTSGGTWTQGEQERLVRLINTEYRDKVAGDWDTVVEQLRATPTNYRRQWTEAERAQLATHIKSKYLAAGRPVDWDRVGRAFGRTVNAIRNTRYACTEQKREERRRQIAEEKSPPRVPEVSEEEAGALRDAVLACRADEQSPVDWDAVAGCLNRPILETLALARSASVAGLQSARS